MNMKPPKNLVDDIETMLNSHGKDQVTGTIQDFYGPNNLRYKLPVGHIDIIQTRSHISHIFFNDDSRFYEPPFIPQTELLRRTKNILDRYFDGESVDFREIPVKIEMGTDFQNSVWNTIHQIPYGEVRSYKWIAEQIGRPKAVRAVGNATGSNPITIIIPCHRVIGSNGNLGGYGGGLERKRQFLTLEGYPVEVLQKSRERS
ncbi:MAG: methylated-DNA--[protein]-cysteine S-methyltransferase [Candidatus Poribacteria bacterium]|nr:methylated-DNA--[protein]-cysteine S-methyltransferase [Candidatus Poribacteria bacterium]